MCRPQQNHSPERPLQCLWPAWVNRAAMLVVNSPAKLQVIAEPEAVAWG